LKKLEIDPRDPNRALWLWLLATTPMGSTAWRTKQTKAAKQRDDEYWDNHSQAVLEFHRSKREAWATDQEQLLTADPDDV
jgi:lipoprotein NlpI